MRDVQIAKSRHLLKGVRDIVELMMGEDERVVLEWPEVISEPSGREFDRALLGEGVGADGKTTSL